MKKVFQLWGLQNEKGFDEQHVLAVVDRMLDVRPEYIVTGQSNDHKMLQKICDRAHQRGVKVHQWSSLFSENDDRYDYDPLIGVDGKPHERVYGENFNFRCPASERNVELFMDMQAESMRGVDFDGVFLDRVRYPSVTNGKLSCFCPDCVKRYLADGIDSVPEGKIIGYEHGRHVFSTEEANVFLAHRARRIVHAVEMVKERFREVSLDLFPPSLAYLVGQDLSALAPLAEFVKPMFYRYTTAPAGLPFETEAFGYSMPEGEQIRAFESIAPGLMWGVEGGYIPGIAEMTPEKIRETIAIIRENGGTGICASWSAVTFPKENLDVFLEV